MRLQIRGSAEGKQLSGLRLVFFHMGNERVDSLAFLFLAGVSGARDRGLLAVKVLVEIEQVSLEELLRRVEGRPDAQTRDAGMLGSIFQRRAHRVNAVLGPLVVAQRHVRGWITEFPPALVAFLHHAFDGAVAAKEMRRTASVALHKGFANSARRYAL